MSGFSALIRPQVIGSALLSLVLAGCGGGGGGGESATPGTSQETSNESAPGTANSATPDTAGGDILEGRFLDAAVSNVRYITLSPTGVVSMSGFTAEDGSFFYRDGETVSFYIGDVLLGSSLAKDIVTPVALVEGATSSDALSNMLRFLQTLDEDSTPSNGIQITDSVHESAADVQVDFDTAMSSFEVQSSLTALIGVATNSPTLPNVVDALTHFRETLLAAYDTNAGESVLNLMDSKWKSTLTASDCPDTSTTLKHTFNIGGHMTSGYHNLSVRDDGTCKGSSYGILMSLYENDNLFSCATGCSLADLNRTVIVDIPTTHTATLIHEPNSGVITIIHEYDDGREVIETMTKE